MHQKNKGILQSMGLIVRWLLSVCIPFGVKAVHHKAANHAVTTYKLGTITIQSIGAIDPMAPYPYLRLAKWLFPTTDSSLIYRQIYLKPGAIFNAEALWHIKKKLMALPYLATVSVTRKVVDAGNETAVADLIIRTKDRFPITVDLSLDTGPLLTITHHNGWGYGHSFSHQLFLKKRWGYGLEYALPRLHGSYLFGGQYYKQVGDTYTFSCQNLWVGKLWTIQTAEALSPCYWITAVSGYTKQFLTRPPVAARENRPYHHHKFVLAKLGFVADGYKTISGVYSLRSSEQLPEGGSVEMLYGYQKGEWHNRHYVGISCIKNIVNPSFRYLHLGCETAAFLHKSALEEAILKLILAYAGPPMRACNGIRQFISINYIAGYCMPKERMLGIQYRDPEALEEPDKDNMTKEPIQARLNVTLDSTLHMPIVVNCMRFVFFGFAHFIALYNRNNVLLNQTLVNSYGMGLQLAHATIQWPTVAFKVGYSPLLGKVVPSVQLSICDFKNKTASKPALVHYS